MAKYCARRTWKFTKTKGATGFANTHRLALSNRKWSRHDRFTGALGHCFRFPVRTAGPAQDAGTEANLAPGRNKFYQDEKDPGRKVKDAGMHRLFLLP